MNILDNRFKSLLQDEINERFLEAQASLGLPATNELSTDLHEIGCLRGYMKAMKEIYDVCDDVMKKLMEPEKKE